MYSNNDVIRPFCIRLPQMAIYATNFDENATMYFRVKELLNYYNEIWGKKLKR